MHKILDLMKPLWLPLVIVAALGFGASEALAGASVDCDPPELACESTPECDDICFEVFGTMNGGTCNPMDCCACIM